jgi:hypothetical protein
MFDMHEQTAARMFGIKPEEVTAGQRRLAKRRNFLSLYSGCEETPEKTAAMDKFWVLMEGETTKLGEKIVPVQSSR